MFHHPSNWFSLTFSDIYGNRSWNISESWHEVQGWQLVRTNWRSWILLGEIHEKIHENRYRGFCWFLENTLGSTQILFIFGRKMQNNFLRYSSWLIISVWHYLLSPSERLGFFCIKLAYNDFKRRSLIFDRKHVRAKWAQNGPNLELLAFSRLWFCIW